MRVLVGEVERLTGEDVSGIASLHEERMAGTQQLPLEIGRMKQSGHIGGRRDVNEFPVVQRGKLNQPAFP